MWDIRNPEEFRDLLQGHTTSNWWNCIWGQACLGSRSYLFCIVVSLSLLNSTIVQGTFSSHVCHPFSALASPSLGLFISNDLHGKSSSATRAIAQLHWILYDQRSLELCNVMALLTGNHTHGYGMDLVITSELLTSEILASQSSFSVLLPLPFLHSHWFAFLTLLWSHDYFYFLN